MLDRVQPKSKDAYIHVPGGCVKILPGAIFGRTSAFQMLGSLSPRTGKQTGAKPPPQAVPTIEIDRIASKLTGNYRAEKRTGKNRPLAVIQQAAMITGMRARFSIGQFGVLMLSGCGLLEPRSTFQITSVDRPVKSASLRLCKQTFPLTHVDSRWKTTIHVSGDCDGGVATVMNNGRIVFCPVGYVTGGDGSNWQFTIKNDVCWSRVTYGDAGSRNGSFPPRLCENVLTCYDQGLIWEAGDGAFHSGVRSAAAAFPA